MYRPFVRNAVSRNRWVTVAASTSSSSKTSESGRNVIVVPLGSPLAISPTPSLSPTGSPPPPAPPAAGGPPAPNPLRRALPVPPPLGQEPLGQRIDDRHTDAVQAAR